MDYIDDNDFDLDAISTAMGDVAAIIMQDLEEDDGMLYFLAFSALSLCLR